MTKQGSFGPPSVSNQLRHGPAQHIAETPAQPSDEGVVLRGIATAAYGRDKRTLDPVSPINVGNQVLLGLPSSFSAVAETMVFEARARNEASPELITLFLNLNPSLTLQSGAIQGQVFDSTGAFVPLSIRAKIEWGSGGASHVAFVDVTQGAVVTVGGTFVRVSVDVSILDYTGLAAPPVFPLVGGVSLSASADYGAIADERRATFCSFAPTLAAATFLIIPIPPFAETVTVYSFINTVPGPANVTVTFSPDGAKSLGSYRQTEDNPRIRMPIPGNAAFVLVLADAGIGNVNVVFTLAI